MIGSLKIRDSITILGHISRFKSYLKDYATIFISALTLISILRLNECIDFNVRITALLSVSKCPPGRRGERGGGCRVVCKVKETRDPPQRLVQMESAVGARSRS